VRGRHTLKGGVMVEYSGQDDFDQINVSAIPAAPTTRTAGSSSATRAAAARRGWRSANTALGLYTNYAELGQRNFTEWRALATDLFLQDSWKPDERAHGRRRLPLGVLAAVVLDTNNIANFDPRFYDPAQAAVINPATGRLVGGSRYNGIVLPGDGFLGDAQNSVVAQDPAVQALFRGEPRGFSQTHTTRSSRASASPTS
jgi:hypothetical protein